MRIDNGSKPDGLELKGVEQAKQATRERSHRAAGPGRGDTLDLSSLGGAVKSLALRVMEDDTALRAIRVSELRQAIADGTFRPNPAVTAEAMLERSME